MAGKVRAAKAVSNKAAGETAAASAPQAAEANAFVDSQAVTTALL